MTIKNTKLYASFVTLSGIDNQKLSKLLRKGFERQVYWNEPKTKSMNKNTSNEYKHFLESNLLGVYYDNATDAGNDQSIFVYSYLKLFNQVDFLVNY